MQPPTNVICQSDAPAYELILGMGILIANEPDEQLAARVGSGAVILMNAALRHPEWARAVIRKTAEAAEEYRKPGDDSPGIDFIADMLPRMFPMELTDGDG